MFLFRNDGSLDAADFLASDDDDGLPAGDFFNSVINTGDEIGVLPAGSYIIAVGDYELSLAEAELGRASCRERGCHNGSLPVGSVQLKKNTNHGSSNILHTNLNHFQQ